jgi:PBSX family phage portal protein
MSELGKEAYEAVLTQGDVSPEKMGQLVGVALFGKSSDSSSTDTTSPTGTVTGAPSENSLSQQLKGDPFQDMAGGEYVQPRFNPDVWAAAMEQNTRLGRAIRAYARNTVGLGWYVEALHGIKAEADSKERDVVVEETRKLKKLLSRPNTQMPLTQLFYLVKIDEEATGNGYIEVVRNAKGEICALYHVPSVTIRVRVQKARDGKEQVIGGFVQIRGNQKRYFKEFGDGRLMDAEKGDYAEAVQLSNRATEILHFKVYSPTSTWYGAPRYVSASPAVAGNRLAAIRNVNFFENDAVPRMALMISGGRLATESVQMIEDFFKNKQRGVENAHRVMVIQAEPQKVGFQQQAEAVKIQMQPMTVGVTEDASFETYRKSNDEEVREAFGISQVFFSSENVNKSSAQVSREITNEQEFEPDRLEKEYILNQSIVRDILGEDCNVQFRFERPKLTDPLDTARMDQTYASLGALTPNELRESIGKARYPKDFLFGDKPLQVAMAELSMQLFEAVKGEFDEQVKHQKEVQRAQQKVQQEGQQDQGGGMPGFGAPGGGMPGEGGAGPQPSGMTGTEESGSVPSSTDESSTPSTPSTSPTTSSDSSENSLTGSEGSGYTRSLSVNKGPSKAWVLVEALGTARELMRDARALSRQPSSLEEVGQ